MGPGGANVADHVQALPGMRTYLDGLCSQSACISATFSSSLCMSHLSPHPLAHDLDYLLKTRLSDSDAELRASSYRRAGIAPPDIIRGPMSEVFFVFS